MKKVLYSLMLVFLFMAAPVLQGDHAQAAQAKATTVIYREVEAEDTEELKEALLQAKKYATQTKPYKVVLSAATYEITNNLTIPSNTIVELKGATILYQGTDGYAIYIAPEAENVTVRGGKLVNGGIYVKGAKSVTLDSIEIAKAPENAIYAKDAASFTAIENCVVNNSNVGIYGKGVTIEKLSKNKIRQVKTFGIYLNEASKVTDLTYNQIDTFGNSMTTYGILISGKNTKVNNVCYNQVRNGKSSGIMLTYNASVNQITYNTVEKCTGDGIGIYNGAICGPLNYNTIREIGGNRNGGDGDYGINIDSVRNGYGPTYVSEVIGNKISKVTYAGIAVYAGNKQSFGTCYVTGNISNNVVEQCGTYKHSTNWKDEEKKGCQSGIYVDQYGIVKGNINNNVINNMSEHGIYIHEWGQVDGSIYNNTVSNTDEVGIELYKGIVKKHIYNNKVSNAKTKGIAVEYSSKVHGNVYNNTISNSGIHGIYVANNSSISNVSGNVITNTKESGIYVGNKSWIKKITKNTVKSPKLAGVQISAGCYTEEISQNKFNSCGTYGIRVLATAKNLLISNNTVTITGTGQPLQLNGSASHMVTIKNNTLTGTKKNYGIRVLNGKVTISGNKISRSTYPICLDSSKKVSGTLTSNVFSQNSNSTIKIDTKKLNHNAPSLGSTKAAKGKVINVSIKKQADATSYEVYRSTNKTKGFKKIATVKTTTYKNTKLAAGKNYYYKVRSVKKVGNVTVYSEYSSVKNAKAIA
ncbi:MAG: right-handed parallel beta-helix repeat-containing protein [bacterium]|nr:right-handed parallel beta-helix repeat-containing protein [bacterium]